MNLPTKVNFGSGDSIVWVYTVSGAKLRKTVYDNGAVIKTIDYVSGFVYENSKLDFFFQDEGRVKRLATGSLQYQYTINDHLGNMRTMFADTNADGQADLLQETHYYPFGSEIGGLSAVYTTPESKNKFTYNGKEAEEEFGLYWYHYGARYYDPALGRWMAIDPADEFNSPYLFVNNNPILLHDPDGYSADGPPSNGPDIILVGGDDRTPSKASVFTAFANAISKDYSKPNIIQASTVSNAIQEFITVNPYGLTSFTFVGHGEEGAIALNTVTKFINGKSIDVLSEKIDIDGLKNILQGIDIKALSSLKEVKFYSCNSAKSFQYKGMTIEKGFVEQVYNFLSSQFGVKPQMTGFKEKVTLETDYTNMGASIIKGGDSQINYPGK